MNDTVQHPNLTRRSLIGGVALGGAVTLGSGALSKLALAQGTATAPAATPAPSPTPATAEAETMEAPAPTPFSETDLEILNFALGLERLEAAFYAQIQGAQQARAFLNPRMLEAAREIGANEIAHVQALETAIIDGGGTPAAAATYRFPSNVFISPVAFTWFAHTLEEIGIGAYLGAIGQIESNALRRAAASIYGSETRHAALLRSLGGFTIAPRYFESPLTVEQVQGLVAPYVA